jgi:hypothetical protein
LAGKDREERDDPRNLLTTASCLHIGVCSNRKIDGHEKYVELDGERIVLHEDIQWAFKNYEGIARYTSFDLVFEVRDDLIREGKIEDVYNFDWNGMMLETADERTRMWAAKGGHFHLVGE